MTKQEKNDAIEVLKEKFSQYNNFYVTNTESLTVAQVTKLRRICFDKKVEMKVAKNTLIKKALESMDNARFSNVFVGDNQLAALTDLKSKNDLIGEIIGLLQSPAKNVISALNAGGKLASLVKALEDRQPQEA